MMENFENGLVAFNFYSSVVNGTIWGHPISAIVSGKETSEEAATVVFNAMGFKTVDDYVDSYPGQFLEGSGVFKIIYGNDYKLYKDWRRNANFSYAVQYDHADEHKFIERTHDANGVVEIFTTVTMEQYKKSILYERRNHGLLDDGPVRYVWLWFCSDWRDPYV